MAWNDTRSGDQDILVAKGLLARPAGSTPTPTPPPNTPTATWTPGPTNTPTPTVTGTPPTATPITPVTTTATATIALTATATATRTGTPPATVTPVCGTGWQVAHQGTNFGTQDVTVVSPTDIWAIGLPASIYHWDGTAWSQVSTPPPPFGPDVLYGLAAAASNDVWAVGSQGGGSFSYPRVLHWDGTAWTYVCCTSSAAGAAPAGGIGQLDDLFDVAALGNGTARVVGERMTDINPVATLFGNCTIAGCSIYPSRIGRL